MVATVIAEEAPERTADISTVLVTSTRPRLSGTITMPERGGRLGGSTTRSFLAGLGNTGPIAAMHDP